MGAGSSLCSKNKIDAVSDPAEQQPALGLGLAHCTRSQAGPCTAIFDPNAIAIVGIGCRTPGADNIREFWKLLSNGECHVGGVPHDRWNSKTYYDPDPMAPGKAYVQRGGFIKDPEGFDSALYGINDFEASHMSPQQKFLLDCTNMALEDAGITKSQISGTNTGVFVGSMNNDHLATFLGHNNKVATHTVTGTSATILSARLSYVFNLLGPSMVLDTACSSSLVAIHLGCQAILTGDCNMAICGGVNAMQIPDVYVHLSKARMISPTGLCQTFSDKADGYIRGEGCGVVILKRLKDALHDGDKIWATVCTGTNQDGHTVSPMTAPSGEQQKKLLHAVYGKFGVDVTSLDYIEAHGTGTPAGDPVEANALGEFFNQAGEPHDRHIGSVKTNIGHTESAAGVLGLIKVLLMMEHDTIVPSLHCDVVNPKINLSDLKLKIPKGCIPWPNPDKLAACNSFGFGGSNSHAIVRSHRVVGRDREGGGSKPCIVCFSANTKKSLTGSLEDLYTDKEAPLLNVHDVSYTSTVRRDHYYYRAAFVVKDMQDLLTDVRDKLTIDDLASPAPGEFDTVFVFCGMGTAWQGMCAELLAENSVFRNAMMEVDKELSAYVKWSLLDRLEKKEDPAQDGVFGPIAIFACQVALTAVWRSLGIQPACVLGQSIGEVAAAYTGGCLGLADAVKIIYHRTIFLAEATGGSMIVVKNVNIGKVQQVLSETGIRASVALEYSPTACAISSSSDVMPDLRRQLLTRLKDDFRDMQLIDLSVTVAYHSPHVDSCAGKLAGVLKGLEASPPKLPLISAVTGTAMTTPPGVSYWVDNISKPVLFRQAMADSLSAGKSSRTVFLEIGPKPVLTAHMKDLFPTEDCTSIPSMLRQSEMKSLLQGMVALYELGADISWKDLPTYGGQMTDVPRYIFDKRYVAESPEMHVVLKSGCNIYSKNHLFMCPSRESAMSFSLMISPLCAPSIFDHVLSDRIIVPGALYAEAGFAVARYSHIAHQVAVSVEFQHPMPLKRDEATELEAHFETKDDTTEVWRCPLVVQKDGRRLAVIRLAEFKSVVRETVNIDLIRSRCKDKLNKDEAYNLLKKFGFEYGEAFALLETVHRSSSESLGLVKLNDIVRGEMPGTTIHPCIIDCMLQSPPFLMVGGRSASLDILPKSVGQLVVHRPMEQTMFVHARLKDYSDNTVVYTHRLLSAAGHVIAEMEDHTVQILSPQAGGFASSTLTMEWQKIVDMEDATPEIMTENGKRELLIISDVDLEEVNGHAIVRYDSKKEESLLDKAGLISILERNKDVKAIVVVFTESPHEEMDGEAAQLPVLNTCCMIQTILTTLHDMSYKLPFYFCANSAWPKEDGKGDELKVNPAATAMCGLFRAVFQERVYLYVTFIDLHMGKDAVALSSLQNITGLLMTDENMSGYSELMVTHDGIFANMILPFAPSALQSSTPSRTVTASEVEGSKIIVSRDVESVLHPLAVPHEKVPAGDREISTTLRVHSFAKPPVDLWKMSLASSCLLPEKQASVGTHAIMALELEGESLDEPGMNVASCCPVTIGTEVSVSPETVIPTASIPDYQAGDLSKLVLLWAIQSKVETDHVTILVSSATSHLAELLQVIWVDTAQSKTVTVVKVDELRKTQDISETLLSLVFLDTSTLSSAINKWKNRRCLVACSTLVSPEALALLACRAPAAEMSLLDTHTLYWPRNLRRYIPDIRKWLQTNGSLRTEIPRALHIKGSGNDSSDMTRLLDFESVSLSDLQVTVVTDKLFRRDSAYIVVGGLTGLGWICVKFLAENEAGYIAIFNRRQPSETKTAEIENLSKTYGCSIEVFQVDISAIESLKEVMKRFSDASFRFHLKGVFIGAAVVDDGPFDAMEREAFHKVLQPKVKGTWNLHQVTKEIPLDYFVMHSSVSSVLGNLGQANYSCANAFLDGLAYYRRQLGLSAQTINWGPLDTGILDNQDEIKQRLQSMGFHMASEFEITETLWAVLRLKMTQSVPVRLNGEVYGRLLYAAFEEVELRRFHKIISPPQTVSSKASAKRGDMSKVKFLEPSKRLKVYESYLRELTSRLVTVDESRISSTVTLINLGLDSVTSMMMINQIHRDTTIKLAAVDVLAGEVTVASVAKMLTDAAEGSGRA
ncbi:hypothetical protein BaRGS_00017892 [Batillaria attramentaria]|uniref:Polyketide synthase n=1 Tax=Batillaria attramentaria TaxID=370345 RepID=A0ABD0KV07_9CAEN